MTFDPEQHRRRSTRAKWHDYGRAGRYFVTICAFERACLFGAIVDGRMSLSEAGTVVEWHWHETPQIRPYVTLDGFMIMPNHLHGVVSITPHSPIPGNRAADTAPRGTAPGSFGAIIQQFKAITTKRINADRGLSGVPVWQRNYYDHVIRDADDLERIRAYIAANPSRWLDDEHNPDTHPSVNPMAAM